MICFNCSDDLYLKATSGTLRHMGQQLHMAWMNLLTEILELLLPRWVNLPRYIKCPSCNDYLMEAEDDS